MVEKIIINPEEIRGYGNIIIPHVTSDYDVVNASLESGTDTVNGQSMTVYELEYAPNLTNTVLSLSVSPSSVYVYDNVVFTAVLEDEDDNPISGATVTFKEGDTVLGTDTTDNTGEASLTLSNLTAGSHSVTANYSGDSTYAGSNSSSVSVSVSHSYSLSFSSSSYAASGGSATLSLTLTDNSVAVSGATVSVTGSDSSVYSGLTNSSGIATITVTGITSNTTFTATYSNVSDTCTVTVQQCLFRDGGVTGDVNTDYTNLNGTINTSVTANGTNISCGSYKDCFRRPNVLLSGDFSAEYTITQTTISASGLALLSSSNAKLYYYEFENDKVYMNNFSSDVASNSSYNASGIVNKTIRFERVSGVLKVYIDDVEALSYNANSTQDVYVGFKTHSASGRNFTFKDLCIKQL